jgi:heat shock protein HtpX
MVALVNNIKTAALLAALLCLLVWVGSFWGTQGMVVAGLMALLMNFGAWFFSDRIAVATMRGRPAAPGTELHDMVDRLARRAGLPVPRVYLCPHQAPNAFATGRGPRHAAVAVTEGALRLLDHAELEGVIGHELAHIRNRDTLISTVAATVAGLLSMLAYWGFWFGGAGGDRRGGHPLALVAVLLLGSIGAGLIRLMISRSREYVADADGARIAGGPHGLVSALRKLEAVSRQVPLHNPNPAMNNMFIVEPLTGGEALVSLFATHPPVEKRIRALLSGR